MLSGEAPQSRSRRRAQSRVGRLAPVDEERHQLHGRRVVARGSDGQRPLEQRAVRRPTRHRDGVAGVEARRASGLDATLEIVALDRERHQARSVQGVDPERTRSLRRRLIGIGPDDLQVVILGQRDEMVAGAETEVLAARRRLDTSAIGEAGDGRGEVGSGPDDVIESERPCHGRSLRQPRRAAHLGGAPIVAGALAERPPFRSPGAGGLHSERSTSVASSRQTRRTGRAQASSAIATTRPTTPK